MSQSTIYFVYATLPSGEEVRTNVCDDWKSARKIMLGHKRKKMQSRALEIDTTSEATENRSLFAPIYYTI